MKVVALAGGVGGAKLVDGLAKNLSGDDLIVIVNTGDDFDHYGLRICPDLDTVCYTLAGISNPATGWGRAEETWNALETLKQIGGPAWFQLGDRDLGLHLERTRLLSMGKSLSEVCDHFCRVWKIDPLVLPMSDDGVATLVHTNEGSLAFQDYFVQRKCEPKVSGFDFIGVDSARPAPGVLDALEDADLVVICPSNPWVSIDPILAIHGIRESLLDTDNPKSIIAVSPIIQGGTLKGPAAKMYEEMGIAPSAMSVMQHYGSQVQGGLLSGFVLDSMDDDEESGIKGAGVATLVTNTIMMNESDRFKLASEVISFGQEVINQ